MASIQIILKTGVIATTERQKQTVLGLGLKRRHQVKILKDTPAIRGMVNSVSHLVQIVEKAPETNPWANAPVQYELGLVKPKTEAPKKKAPKKNADSVEAKAPVKASAAKSSKAKAESKKAKSTSTKKAKK